mmetsp:Transcript_34173/g.74666  ORF Transcript_34173/g.74666 Transcript_34173/m.74666 type:complete len:300 (-) Transcript_34173:739-1638(-)
MGVPFHFQKRNQMDHPNESRHPCREPSVAWRFASTSAANGPLHQHKEWQTASPRQHPSSPTTTKKATAATNRSPLQHGHRSHHVERLAVDIHKTCARHRVTMLETLHKIETPNPQRCFTPRNSMDDTGVAAVLLRRLVRRHGLTQVLRERTRLAVHCRNNDHGPGNCQGHDGVTSRCSITHRPQIGEGRRIPAQNRPASRPRVHPGVSHCHCGDRMVLIARRHLQDLLAPQAIVKTSSLDLSAERCKHVLRVAGYEGVRSGVARGIQGDGGLGRSALAVPPNYLEILRRAQQSATSDER